MSEGVSRPSSGPAGTRLRDDARRIASLAWPMFAGQVAVLAFGTVDTVLLGRHAPLDLAALAIGTAAYVSIFVGLMGVVLAIGPIAARSFGAGRLEACGAQLLQALWLAGGLSVLGCLLLWHPAPFLWLARPEPEVEAKVRAYLGALAFALPSALLFAALRGFHGAVSRPRVVMLLQFGALAIKLPLTTALALGVELPAVGLRLPALGVAGCGWATAIAMGLQCVAAWWVVRRDPFYAAFGLRRPGWVRPDPAALRELARLGVPMGLSILVEVTAFTFMSIFIARLGATVVAGHQVAANLTGLLFMLPLALGNASGALVAQRLGAGEPDAARRLGRHAVQLGVVLAAGAGVLLFVLREPLLALYTTQPEVAATAFTLLAFVSAFHVIDALQAVTAAVLRAHQVVTRPLVIYALCAWGIGLGGGAFVGLDPLGIVPAPLQGANGFWAASTLGLAVASAALLAMLVQVDRQQAPAAVPAPALGVAPGEVPSAAPAAPPRDSPG